VLCWNVRGLNAHEKWGTFRDEFLEVVVILFVYRKLKDRVLILLSLKSFIPLLLIPLNTCLPLVLLWGLSLFGSPVS
jgi:hypothetical protein